MNRYFIIGAGLSGLRIGQLLASDGRKVEIFETDREVGGLMQTERRGDFLFDIGKGYYISYTPHQPTKKPRY
jgi:protoporphyrinogen oxidase